MKLKFHGGVLIVIAASLWALDGILRRSLYHLPSVTIVFYEHLVGSLLLLPFAVKAFAKEKTKITKQVIMLSIVIALFGGLLGTLFITTALSRVSFIPFSVVFLIQKLQPIFVISTAAVFLKEKISKNFLVWSALALVAGFFVTFKNGVVNFAIPGTITAALFSFGAAAFWGFSTTLGKKLVGLVSETMATALRFYIATFFAFVASFVLGAQSGFLSVGPSEISRLFVIGLSTGLVAMWLYYRGLQTTQAKVATILELTFPLLAVFVDMFLYKTFLAPSQYLAALVLLFAMIQVSRTHYQETGEPVETKIQD